MFVVVTGAPCSGKSEWIAKHIGDAPAFIRGGLYNSPCAVRKSRRAFIKNHASDVIAFIEAQEVSRALADDLRGMKWREVKMRATFDDCIDNLILSDRTEKARWAAIICKRYHEPLRCPEYDADLAAELKEERESCGNNRKFYKSLRWRALRAKVLDEFHGECIDCKNSKPSRATRAKIVHHVLHVEECPGLALSEWVTLAGEKWRNLEPLCQGHHEVRHSRFAIAENNLLTKERW